MMHMLDTRHWAIVITAVIVSFVVMIFAPDVIAIFEITRYSLPIIAGAMFFYTFSVASDRYSAALKAIAWSCLVVASCMAFMPLIEAINELRAHFQSLRQSGWPVDSAIKETVLAVVYAPAFYLQRIFASLVIGAITVAATIFIPLRSIFIPRIGGNRQSSKGPWRAKWMEKKDIARLARNKTGLPLAIHKGKLLRYDVDNATGWRGGHHLAVAGTRGGKGICAVIPAILEHQGPVVTLDIKGENFAVTRRHRQMLGRKVAILNPFNVIAECQDTFNPLDYIRREHLKRDLDLIADGLVKQEKGDGAHFSEMARQLVSAAIEVVYVHQDAENKNLVAVSDLLLSAGFEETLQNWSENPDLVGYRPAQIAATILQAGDRERGSIQTSIAKAFDWMQSDEMRCFLQQSSFQIDDLLDDKLDLFIVVPLDQIEKQAIFMRLFINLVLGTVVRQDGKRRVKAPILLVLDEFVRMGRMEQVMNIANVAAGAGIEALFVTQDIGQVEKVYGPNDARSIFGSCVTKRIFNINDIYTAEWVSSHSGENTVFSQQIREKRTLTEKNDFSFSEQRQKLITPDQIMGMKPNDLLMLISNRSPLIARQNLYFKNRDYRGMFDKNPLN